MPKFLRAFDLVSSEMWARDLNLSYVGTRECALAILALFAVIVATFRSDPALAQENLETGKIYWSDPAAEKIQRADPDGSNVEDLVGGFFGVARGIAFDFSVGRVYWTGQGIFRANLDGTSIEDLGITTSLPHGIAIDQENRKAYWVDNGIHRANLDGSDAEELVTPTQVEPELIFPRGIALDVEGGKMYWTELGAAGPGRGRGIRRANLDGSEVETLIADLPQAFNIALDLDEGKMYWVEDVRGGGIRRANLDGTGIELLNTNLERRRAISLDLEAERIYWSTVGAIGRSALDGSGSEIVVDGLFQPLAVALLPDAQVGSAITTFLSSVVLGELFSKQFEVASGTPPVTWSIVDGELPVGLDLSADGVLSGTPERLGSSSFTLRATDGGGETSESDFTVEVVFVLPSPDIRLSKTGTRTVPGRRVDYFIAVENRSDRPLQESFLVEVPDPIGSFEFLGAGPVAEIEEDDLIVWKLPVLLPDRTTVLSYSVTLNPDVPRGTEISGAATVRFGGGRAEEVGVEELKRLLDHRRNAPDCVDPACVSFALVACGDDGFQCSGTFGQCLQCWRIIRDCVQRCTRDELFPGDYSVDEQIARRPVDPNEKVVTARKFIQPDQTLIYAIHFENIGDIEALDVFLSDVLDPGLDTSTLEILTPDGALFDAMTRTVDWELLERNLEPGETDNVIMAIRPFPDLPSGTEIRNNATIQFEIFEIITTEDVVNVIDRTPPECRVDVLPAEIRVPFGAGSVDRTISWTGADAIGEIDSFSVFVSEDGNGFVPLALETEESSAEAEIALGRSYEFLCVARDTAGNVEAQGLVAETVTRGVPGPTSVPDLVGMTLEDAQKAVAEAGLNFVSSTASSNLVPPGVVITQDPASSSEVEPGSTVAVVVSSGPAAGIPGDLDGDGDVDRDDLAIVLGRRNTPALGPDDPLDLDGDGAITGLDARQLTLLCSRPRCATG